jgi:hypothetical protein
MSSDQILKTLRESADKGGLLERVLVELLEDLGFRQVRRQLAGSQFGFDVSGCHTSRVDGRQEVWKFECKNLTKSITLEDIAPKLVWHHGRATIDHFVIVGTSTISNELDFILQTHQFPMSIHIWTYVDLAQLIAASPRAMSLLNLRSDPNSAASKSDYSLIGCYPAAPISLDVVHWHDPPHAFDYVKVDGEITKAYTSTELRLLLSITNPSKTPLDVHTVDVVTVGYRQLTDRVLRLVKPKGLIEPIKVTFQPSQRCGSAVHVLEDRIWQIDACSTEHLVLVLDKAAGPGLYSVMFRIHGRCNGESITRLSPIFVFHVEDTGTDLLTLQVVGRHYDSPAAQVLNLPRSAWKRLKREVKPQNMRVYLGPTDHEVVHHKTDTTWMIRSIKTQPGRASNTASWSTENPYTVVLDLGTPVDEELYSATEAFRRVSGSDRWQDLLPLQLKRRRARN